jgi:hypothetical protein
MIPMMPAQWVVNIVHSVSLRLGNAGGTKSVGCRQLTLYLRHAYWKGRSAVFCFHSSKSERVDLRDELILSAEVKNLV